MTAPITDADRAAAHEALIEKPLTCDDMRPGISHDWICEDVAQAIADARAAENRACEKIARDDVEKWGDRTGCASSIARNIADRRSR